MFEVPSQEDLDASPSDKSETDEDEFDVSFDAFPSIESILKKVNTGTIIKRVNTETEKLRSVTNKMTRQGKDVLRVGVDAGAEKLKTGVDSIRSQSIDALRIAYTANAGRNLHKYCYIIMKLNIIFTALWIGRFPEFFCVLYVFKLMLLLPIRLLLYRWKRQHYFLIDFCYFANFLLIGFIFIAPNKEALWKICFSFHGMLGISIPLFANAMVPHSIDQMTSAELHIAPSLAIYCFRWFNPKNVPPILESILGTRIPGVYLNDFDAVSGFDSISVFWSETFPSVCLVYSLWAVPYYTKIFLLRKKRKSTTLYSFCVKRFSSTLPLPLARRPRFAFLLMHFLTFLVGCFIGAVTYHNYYLHSTFVISMVVVLCKNGANFYVFKFAKDYERNLRVFEEISSNLESDSEFLRFTRFGKKLHSSQEEVDLDFEED